MAMKKAALLVSVVSFLGAACFLLCLPCTNEQGKSIKTKEARPTDDITAAVLFSSSSRTNTRTRRTKEITISSCSTSERRALARRSSSSSNDDPDDTTTEDEWKAMTECLVDQQTNHKLGHFFMHVSKSGGTSMRSTFSQETKCYTHPTRPGVDIYYIAEGQGAQWFKRNRTEALGLKMPAWGDIKTTTREGVSCDTYEQDMHKQSRLAVESEHVVGFESDYETKMGGGGGCRKFIMSTIFREPVSRILSHYKMLGMIGGRVSREKMMSGDQIFDVDFMVDAFDVISDNYYTRSFVGHGNFEWESPNMTLVQHPKAWSSIFPAANATLHNMDWIILMSSGEDSEAADRDLILERGMGLGSNVTFQHTRTAHNLKHGSLSDEQKLRDINALDYKLWEEALELNRLDVLSLKRMEPYYTAAVEATKEERSQHCCGLVCWHYDDEEA